jgi:hypothetical protein
MARIQARDLDSADETRTPEKTRVDVVRMGDATAARFTFEPGWKWSECIKPVAGTESCAWVAGDERFAGFEFESRSAEEYARQ